MNTPTKTQVYALATLSYFEDSNILIYRVKQDIVVDVPEMNEMLKYVQGFMGNIKHLAIIDFGTNVMSSTEARKIYANSEYIQTYRIADAFVVKSLAVRLVANFFINVTKPQTPTKLFTEEQLAYTWLKKFALQHSI